MSNEELSPAVPRPETTQSSAVDEANPQQSRKIRRRSFLKGIGVTGAAVTLGTGVVAKGIPLFAEEASGSLTKGDASILRFLAAAEIIESDIWLQYQELGGVQDSEVSTLASKLIPGYPAAPTGGNPVYMQDLLPLDGDMSQYIHDNTEDELSHEVFINAYLASKGADTVNLDRFRTLPSSKATGANQFGRLTNLMQLTVDTTWWTRYRSRAKNPDFGNTFAPAIPSLAVGQHPAIPRTDADTNDANFIQAIANTAGFHFAWIEQGGTSLYPKLAQRVTNVEVLRILLSIGGTEICHFQTWHDKAGNAPHLTNVIDPVTGVSVTFPDLNSAPFGGENFQTNLIMPEPTVFLSRQFPPCSIIRPTETKGGAMGAVQGLTGDGLFIGQSKDFFQYLRDLAEDADEARRGDR
ncbi:MAG TPA: twin-arginine translocation signal domain-containing protein [Candidatus Acidoferrum sp.]|nr:twin-arginine translocation signal domain-containing protein [Candidatus Acidoferrum sp.]